MILGVGHTLASDAIAMHRFQVRDSCPTLSPAHGIAVLTLFGPQLSVFTAAAMVFAVIEVNQTIFSSESSLEAVGAGWLLLAVVDVRPRFWRVFLKRTVLTCASISNGIDPVDDLLYIRRRLPTTARLQLDGHRRPYSSRPTQSSGHDEPAIRLWDA